MQETTIQICLNRLAYEGAILVPSPSPGFAVIPGYQSYICCIYVSKSCCRMFLGMCEASIASMVCKYDSVPSSCGMLIGSFQSQL